MPLSVNYVTLFCDASQTSHCSFIRVWRQDEMLKPAPGKILLQHKINKIKESKLHKILSKRTVQATQQFTWDECSVSSNLLCSTTLHPLYSLT
jgi:hypothetical protein